MVRPIRTTARRLRRDSTPAERRLWQALRDDALGVPFRRQHPILPYVADFAAPRAMLVVEVDGGQHGGPDDERRDAAMMAAGWRVMRFWNNEVLSNLEGVLHVIREVLEERLADNPHPGPPPLRGRGGSGADD